MPDRVRIESLGLYVPETVVSMEELLASCRRRPRWDLERITGIHQVRQAVGEHEQDLAIKAAKRALAMSAYDASDLDVIICTSICKLSAEDMFSCEPTTAVVLRRALGATRAMTFDLVNACAGMLNGIYVVQSMIQSGAVRRGMVVSGEKNTPLAETAQREIRHSFDGQIAALTLGDCGAAVILDRSDEPDVGFHCLDLVSGPKHHPYCYSKPSPKGPGGILVTRARAFQRKGAEHFPFYLKQALDATGWTLDEVDHIIPHQVSVRAIDQGIKVVNRFMGCEIPKKKFLCCADRYGNTTTTSHWLVLHEFIENGRIRSGDRILFVSGASGIVITHATLTLDQLPARYRAKWVERA